jgi:hypothetical protein
MSPREVSGLQSLAMAHGGTLTINPQTGLPEAGFLDSLLPTLLGGAATFFSGGTITPLMAAMGVGGLTALTSKDLGKGLMAGLGAYGGGSIAGGLMNFGEAAIGAEAARGALPAGVDKFGAEAMSFEPAQMAAEKAARAGATNFDRLSTGVTEGFKNPMSALSAIGGGSKFKGAMTVGAPLLSALSTQEATPAPTFQQIQFDPRAANINMRREQLPYQPDTGSSAQRRYFTPMTIDQYGADGGFVADGGIQHFASGGVPLDPNYDYSGYGRKKSTAPVPVVKPVDVPKPDFVGADGKTYRYDTMKKSWYVIKDAAAKTNPGVAVLMGGEGGEGGAGDYGGKGPYGGNSINAFTNSPLGTVVGNISNALTTPKTADEVAATPVVDKTGVPTQTGVDYGKPSWGKTGDVDQDIGPVAVDPSTGLQGQGTAGQTGLYGDAAAVNSAQAQAQAAAEQDTRDARAEINAAPAAAAPAAPDFAYAAPALDANKGLAALAEAKSFADAFAGMPSMMSAPNAQVTASNTPGPMAADSPDPDAAPEVTGPSAGDYGGPTAAPAADVSGIAALDAGPTAAPAADVSGIAALDSGPTAAPEVTGPSAGDYGGPSAAPEAAAPEAAAPESAGPESAGSESAGSEGGGGGAGEGDGGGGEGDGGDGGGGGDFAYGGTIGRYAQGGLGSLGGYSDGGRLLRGPGDGVSDHIPATIGRARRPARLADGEFVVPARIVSELGNGSTEAGARALYKMMDRIQANRRKTTGKNRVAVDSKARKYLPA